MEYVERVTDAESAALRERVNKLADAWIKTLGLGFWRIDLAFYNNILEKGQVINATVTSDWEYLQATVNFNVSQCMDLNDDRLEGVFVHELMHIMVCELREEDEDLKHEERVVSQLTNAMIWLRDITADKHKERSLNGNTKKAHGKDKPKGSGKGKESQGTDFTGKGEEDPGHDQNRP